MVVYSLANAWAIRNRGLDIEEYDVKLGELERWFILDTTEALDYGCIGVPLSWLCNSYDIGVHNVENTFTNNTYLIFRGVDQPNFVIVEEVGIMSLKCNMG